MRKSVRVIDEIVGRAYGLVDEGSARDDGVLMLAASEKADTLTDTDTDTLTRDSQATVKASFL
jgi:hypothetical protein